ncbi:unnamed protein product [Mycena citricolor]|uniref:Uncharacterized protein n=1 Tax=Mycena citricolor TaxID=2018698 RepID=A0AAD2HJW6_9AGAR|nr:unnamed protein product [Mycena citricolor]
MLKSGSGPQGADASAQHAVNAGGSWLHALIMAGEAVQVELSAEPVLNRACPNLALDSRWRMHPHGARFSCCFEDILDFGVNQGWYDPGVLLEALVFRWVFIPWLQAELDNYRNRVNNTAKRHDRNKILPNGVPSHMFEFPEDYAILDFKIKADPVGIQKVRDMYAPPDHEIFQLVPLDFEVLISQIYRDIGEPPVNRKSCWEVYRRLLSEFNKLNELHVMHQSAHWTRALEMASNEYPDKIEVLPNLKELRGGEDVVGPGAYMGGVNQDPQHYARLGEMLNEIEPDLGPVEEEPESLYAWFSDEEDDLVADGDW